MDISRRALLAAVPGLMLARGGSTPFAQFPQNPRERLAVTSWPFRNYIASPANKSQTPQADRIDVTQFAAFVAEKFGVHNINPLAAHFSSTDAHYLASFREAVSRARSHVVDLGLGGQNYYDPDATMREHALGYSRKWIDIAVIIGSPSIRQHLQLRTGQKPDVSAAAEGLARLAEYGSQRNIVINIENDDLRAEDPFVIVEVIGKVSNPYLRALPDFGNTLEGHDADYNERGVGAMLSHAWNMCHVKDSVRTQDGRMKRVDLGRLFEVAQKSGYHGYYSMEFDTDAGDPVEGTKSLIRQTLQFLA